MKREKITMAAKNIEGMTKVFQEMHPDDGDYSWAANINYSTDPSAIREASSRGLLAFDITRWKVKVR